MRSRPYLLPLSPHLSSHSATPRHFLLSVLLLVLLGTALVAHAAPSPHKSAPTKPTPNNPTPKETKRFPQNLHRLYDGTWDTTAKLAPFNTVPRPPDPHPTIQPNSTQGRTLTPFLQPVHAVASAPQPTDLVFRKKSGFALLTVDNHRSALGDPISIVFGELLLRDGVYRSPRDVSLRIIGVYDSDLGTLVVVGDVLFEDVSSALQRLYHAFVHERPAASTPDYFNVTEEAFVAALTPRFEKHRKHFPAQRAGATRASGVAAQCPFSASFSITPGSFDDSLPTDSEIPTTQPYAAVPNAPPGTTNANTGPPVFFSGRIEDQDERVEAQEVFVEMKGVFKSKACQTEMNLVLSTLDTETLFGKAINYTLLVTVVAFLQVIVLIRQMEMTSTQAGARRVSLMTVGLQAVADSYLCLGHLTMGIAVQTLFNAFATAAFFKFICFSIFLMRWMLLIWKARRPSGFSEGWEAMRRELSLLYTRFYGSLLLGILLLYQMQNHLRFFLFALYSFWVPQIILNAVEDHRRPLLPIYIMGTSLTRLAIPLYFWGCPRNFLHIQPRPVSAIALVVWLMSQALMLLSQYKFGPRWFIPKELLPEKYDYYRAITVEDDALGSDIEAQVENGEGGEDGEGRPLMGGEANEPRRECCICMESVAVHSRERMVTPCNHFFHAACLERWLEVRLECALCRSAVPPP